MNIATMIEIGERWGIEIYETYCERCSTRDMFGKPKNSEKWRCFDEHKYVLHFTNKDSHYEHFELAEQYPDFFSFNNAWFSNCDEHSECNEYCEYCNNYKEEMYIKGSDGWECFQSMDCDGWYREKYSARDIENKYGKLFEKLHLYMVFS